VFSSLTERELGTNDERGGGGGEWDFLADYVVDNPKKIEILYKNKTAACRGLILIITTTSAGAWMIIMSAMGCV
jgi:hypothetical protein